MTASQAGEAGWWDQLVWNAAESLGNARASLVGSEPEMPMGEAPSSRDELVDRLRADYDRNYFLTGDIDVPLYTEDCEFADPFTSFRGRQRFVQNLKKLGHFQRKVPGGSRSFLKFFVLEIATLQWRLAAEF